MEAFEYKKGNTVVVELRGRVDEFNTAILRDELETLINTGKFWIALDLKQTDFISAHCLNAVWSAKRKVQRLGGDIALTGAKGQVLETIEYVNFSRVVKHFITLDECISYLEGTRAAGPSPNVDDGFHPLDKIGTQLKSVVSKFLKAGVVLVTLIPWDAFPSNSTYTLQEVLQIAREASGQIRLARLRMMEKEADIQIAKSAGLPKLMGTLGYVYQNNPNIMSELLNKELAGVRSPADVENVEGVQTRSRVEINSDVTVVSLGAAQIIYSGGILKNQMALKEAQKNEADAQFIMETLAIEEQIRNAYIGLLLAREKVALLVAQRKALEERMVAVQRAREAKTISEIQFAEIEILNLKTNQEYLSAQREERSLRGLINIGIGRPLDAELVPVPTSLDTTPEIQSADHYFEIAVHRYPELRKTMALIDSAAAYQNIVRAQRLFAPTAAIFGSVDHIQGISTSKQDVSWSLGFGVIVPLYDGGKSLAEFDKSAALASQARIAHEETEKKLKVEINEVITKIDQARLQLELAKKSSEIAIKRKKEAERAVQEGQLPQYRLSEVQAQEIETKMAIIAAQAELYRWHARLMLLTGQTKL